MTTSRRAVIGGAAALGLVLAAGAGASARTEDAEHTAHRRSPGAPPNLVYHLMDDQSDHHNAMDLMPNAKAIGAKGIRFSNMRGDSASCGSQRVSILTAMSLNHHGLTGDRGNNGGFNKYQEMYGADALPARLQAAGYKTYGVGRLMQDENQDSANPIGFDEWHFLCGTNNPFAVWDFWTNDGSVVNGVTTSAVTRNHTDYVSDWIGRTANDIISRQTDDQPWAIFIWWSAPHGSGYVNPATDLKVDDAPEPHPDDLFVNVGNQQQGGNFNEADVSDKPLGTVGLYPLGDPATWNFIWQSRRRACLCPDRWIGVIDAQLKARNWFNTCITLLSADNGYSELGNRLGEKIMLYDQAIRIPGLIRYPALIPKTGAVVDALVNSLDFTATILDLTGATPVLPVDGMSLRPFFGATTPPPWRQDVLVQNTISHGVYTVEGDLYTETVTPTYGLEREYYEDISDPLQLRNRIGTHGTGAVDPGFEARVAYLQGRLSTLVSG